MLNRKIVVDGEILAELPDCGWQVLYHRKISPPPKALDFSSFVIGDEMPFCILVPYGKSTLGFVVELDIKGKYVNLKLKKRVIGKTKELIALLVYVGMEIIRTGLYWHLFSLDLDDKRYFESIKDILPETYEVRINGEYVPLDVYSISSLAETLLQLSYSEMKRCFSCPLMRSCPSPPDPFNLNPQGILFDKELFGGMEILHRMYKNLFKTLPQEGLDPLFLLSMDILYQNLSPSVRYIKNGVRFALKSLNLNPHLGYVEDFGEEFYDFKKDRIEIFDRNGLNEVTPTLSKLRRYRIYCDCGEVTHLLLARTIARNALLGLRECEKLSRYLDRFGREKELIYMAMLSARYPWKRRRFDEEFPVSQKFLNVEDAYIASTNFLLKLESTVKSSKAYREGLIEIFHTKHGRVLGATEKLIAEVFRLCGGEGNDSS